MLVECLGFWAVQVDDDIVWLALANVEIVTMIFVIALRVLVDASIDCCYGSNNCEIEKEKNVIELV